MLAAAALTLGACGEKEESISPETTVATTTTAEPAIQPEVAEKRAREAASAAVPNGFKVRPADWKVSCAGGEGGGQWSCTVSAGPCRGKVLVSPPSGADANAITTNAKGVGCKAN